MSLLGSVEDERDVARHRHVPEPRRRTRRVELVRREHGNAVRLDKIRSRTIRHECRRAHVGCDRKQLRDRYRRLTRNRDTAGLENAQQGGAPRPIASGQDDHAVARLNAAQTQEVGPLRRLTGEGAEPDVLDDAERVDEHERVAIAPLVGFEQIDGHVGQFDDSRLIGLAGQRRPPTSPR